MARTSHFSKQALIIFLAFVLHFTAFTNAYAATSSAMGGWSIVNTIQQGATTIFNLSKTAVINGANVAKTSTAKIAPTAGQVAKNIAKVGAVAAVDLAIKALIGAVDYVMDPANNRVIYYEDLEDNSDYQYGYISNEANVTVYTTSEAVSALSNFFNSKGLTDRVIGNCSFNSDKSSIDCAWWFNSSPSDQRSFGFSRVNNPNYDPNAEKKEKYLPYSAVASQVIDDAESGRTTVAPPYIGGIAQDLTNNGQAVGGTTTAGGQSAADVTTAQKSIASQAESNAKTQTQDTSSNSQVKPNEAGGYDITLEFPAFCGWAPSVCEAAQVVISFPQLITNWWDTATTSISEAWTQVKDWVTEATDYFKEEPDLDNDTELEIPDITESPDTTISFGGYCPAPLSTPVNFAGISTSIDIEFTWLCQLADFIKPIVIALSSFTAALIVAGIRMEDD